MEWLILFLLILIGLFLIAWALGLLLLFAVGLVVLISTGGLDLPASAGARHQGILNTRLGVWPDRLSKIASEATSRVGSYLSMGSNPPRFELWEWTTFACVALILVMVTLPAKGMEPELTRAALLGLQGVQVTVNHFSFEISCGSSSG